MNILKIKDKDTGAWVGIPAIQGPAGKDGKDGSNGADGKTPVKGTDYWTAEDKAEVVAEVLASLSDGDGVSY